MNDHLKVKGPLNGLLEDADEARRGRQLERDACLRHLARARQGQAAVPLLERGRRPVRAGRGRAGRHVRQAAAPCGVRGVSLRELGMM